ncbi:hypothetical protein AB0C76_33145 [Kitasatospora sp. NPDC048722]|uniref:hypothetical protein n=1 Tax=Kitasatospora sp. NPDC048722 TaxID=3155639 RepID=UPI003405D4FF
MKNGLVRWGGAVAVLGGGVAIAGASALDHVAAGWWVLWGACALATVAGYVVRHRARRRP